MIPAESVLKTRLYSFKYVSNQSKHIFEFIINSSCLPLPLIFISESLNISPGNVFRSLKSLHGLGFIVFLGSIKTTRYELKVDLEDSIKVEIRNFINDR